MVKKHGDKMKKCSIMMMSTVLYMAMAVAMVTCFDFEFEDVFVDEPPPPLPVFDSVGYKPAASGKSGVIQVSYRAPEEPHVKWFVDDFPLPEGYSEDHFGDKSKKGGTMLSVNREHGRQLSVCLQNFVAETCLQFAPLPVDVDLHEELAFPWPLLIPAPLARYTRGEDRNIYAPVLETPHNYTYSAIFLSKNPSRPDGPIVEARSRDMTGGQNGDVVRIGPVTSGTGWMLEVETNVTEYEGVLLFTTTFTPESEMVQKCMATRPISIYRRDHRAPFPTGFVAMVSFPLPWRCREHFDCLVLCPFLSNGDVNVTLSRQGADAVLNNVPLEEDRTGMVGETRMLGPYYGWASFYIEGYRRYYDRGTYLCRVDSRQSTGISLIKVF